MEEQAVTLQKICEGKDDVAAFELIFRTLRPQLDVIMNGWHINEDDKHDVLMAFYEYLRGSNDDAYAMLKGIKDKKKFYSWTKQTFRYFVNNRMRKDGKSEVIDTDIPDGEDEDETLTFAPDDILKMLQLFEVANRILTPKERYIWYSDLLDLKDHKHGRTNDIAFMLNCTPGNVRVMRKRLQEKLALFLPQI